MSIDFKYKYLGIILFLISGYFVLFNFPFLFKEHVFCLFKRITGFPCPACGSLRASFALFRGAFLQSILINPFALITNLFFLFSLFWMLYDIIRNKETFIPSLEKKWSKTSLMILGIIVVSNWIWNIYKGL